VIDRSEFTKKAEVVLEFVDAYGTLRCSHLEKFFPESQKAVNYLIKHKRLYESPDKIYISADEEMRPEKSMMAALSMLGDIAEKVKTHTRAEAPTQISFFTHSGDYYEIVYVGYGLEAMVSAAFGVQLAARKRNAGPYYADTTKRMVIVEDINQMEQLQIPNIARFALVKPDGSLTYYKGAGK